MASQLRGSSRSVVCFNQRGENSFDADEVIGTRFRQRDGSRASHE